MTTSAVRPSATGSPSARITTRWASSAASSTSWVARMMAWPAVARSRRTDTKRDLAA